jgi:predicted HTH transcriptional regulator
MGSGMKKIMEKYTPEDYEISENFVVASFKYNEHALEVLNGLWPTQIGPKVTKLPEGLSPLDIAVLKAIAEGKYTTAEEMAESIGSTGRTIRRITSKLKDLDLIRRAGSKKKGEWEVMPNTFSKRET